MKRRHALKLVAVSTWRAGFKLVEGGYLSLNLKEMKYERHPAIETHDMRGSTLLWYEAYQARVPTKPERRLISA